MKKQIEELKNIDKEKRNRWKKKKGKERRQWRREDEKNKIEGIK